MRKESRNEDAVSPVIGVMLMLVVTVVIAAVVVMFSTGLAGDTKTTPTALFEVSYTGTWNGDMGSELANVGLRHKGGDVIPLKDLQITLESRGGPNSGIVLTHQASDAKTKKDMNVGDYIPASDYHKSEFDRLKGDYESAVEEIATIKNKYGITEDTSTWEDPDYYDEWVDEWTGLKEKYNMENWDDIYALIAAQEKSVNRLNAFNTKGWDINADAPPSTISGGDAYAMSVLGQEKPTESTVSTGDIIHVVSFDGSSLSSILAGSSVKWTISYIPTNSVIAKGEFDVIAD